MGRLRDSVRSEREEQSSNERSRCAAGQLAGKQEHAETRQHERGQKQHVVAEDRICRHRVDWKDLDRLRDEVFRIRECQRCGVKDVRVEEVPQVRIVPLQDASQLFAIPREDPHVEHRVAKVPCHVARDTGRERPRHRHRYQCVCSRRIRGVAAACHSAGVGQSFLEEHLKDCCRWDGENRAHDSEQRAADQQRDDDEHRADAHLPLHDLRHEQMIFKLLLRNEKDDDAERKRRTRRRAPPRQRVLQKGSGRRSESSPRCRRSGRAPRRTAPPAETDPAPRCCR